MDKEFLDFIKLISEPTRLQILHQLRRKSCVGELWQCLDLPQNLVSHHLKVLRQAGVVEFEKIGLKVVYRLNEKKLKENLEKLNHYLK